MNRDCTFKDFVDICKATLYEIYDLRYGLKITRNQLATKLREDQDIKDEAGAPPIKVKGKHVPSIKQRVDMRTQPKGRLLPPKPQPREARRLKRVIHQEISDVLQHVDNILSMSDILDDLLSGNFDQLDPNDPNVIKAPKKDSEDTKTEEEESEKSEGESEELENKEEAKASPEAKDDAEAPPAEAAGQDAPKAEENAPEGEAKEEKEEKPYNPNDRFEINEENLIPNIVTDKNYEHLFHVLAAKALPDPKKEKARLNNPEGADGEPKTPPPKRPNKRALIRMRPYSLDPLDVEKISKTHEHNLKVLREVLEGLEFERKASGMFNEVRAAFAEADVPFTLTSLNELIAGYGLMDSTENALRRKSKYQWFPTKTNMVPLVPPVPTPPNQHAERVGAQNRFDFTTRKRWYPKFTQRKKYRQGDRKPHKQRPIP